MKIIQFQTASDFLTTCEPFLLENETENNKILGLAQGICRNNRTGVGELFFSVLNEDKIVGAALRIRSNKPLLISRMPNEGVDHLLEVCSNQKLSGVVGESACSIYFSKKIEKKHGCKSKLIIHQGVYECRKLLIPKLEGKKLIQVTEEHFEHAVNLIESFIKDAHPHEKIVQENIINMTNMHISMGSLFLLKNEQEQFVSMACNVRNTKNSGCVSLVYTPKEFRRNGYGALVTALVSKEILKRGKLFCNLFTDLNNPTSNKIYKEIGYKKIGESKHFSFL